MPDHYKGLALACLTAACTPSWVADRTAAMDQAVTAPAKAEPRGSDDVFPGPTLTVSSAVDDVVARNADLVRMRSSIRAMIAMARVRAAPAEPMLEFGLDPLTIHTGLGQMVAYRHPLSWTAALDAAARASLHDADAMSHDLEAMKRMLAAMAGEAVAEHAAALAMQRLLVRHHELMDLMARAARARISAGRSNLNDPLRAETEKAEADRDRFLAQRMAETAKIRLLTLAHRRPDGDLPTCDPDVVLAAGAPRVLGAEETLAEADGTRLEIRSAEARLAARRAEVESTEIMRRPMMSLGVVLNTMQEDPMMWPSLTFSIELPTQGGRQAMVDAAAFRADEAEAEITVVRNGVAREAAERRAELLELQAALEVVERRLLPAARKSLELATVSYQGSGAMNGGMGIEPVVLAADAVLEAEMSRVNLLSQRLIASLMLDLALGRMPGTPVEGGGTP